MYDPAAVFLFMIQYKPRSSVITQRNSNDTHWETYCFYQGKLQVLHSQHNIGFYKFRTNVDNFMLNGQKIPVPPKPGTDFSESYAFDFQWLKK